MAFKHDLWLATKLYWKTAFIIVYPLVLLPIFVIYNNAPNRMIYLITVMAGFWITEALPLPMTGLIPVAFFPLMGIINTSGTVACYFTDSTMLFFAGYMLALGVESSNLHMRISLHIIKIIGFSPKKLHIGFSCVTMFVSMWISNTATAALMVPIVMTTLRELETNGIGKIYQSGSLEEDKESEEEDKRVPTKATMAYMISIAYSATIGGTGYITGTASNLEFKGIYETTFPNLKINSGHWFILCLPYMIITMILTILWIQILYLGLFRPKSSAAQESLSSPEEKLIASTYVTDKLEAMGLITFYEIAVAICFVGAILLWLFRMPEFFGGWADLWIPHGGTVIKDSTVAVAIIIVMFLVPRSPACCFSFSSDVDKQPKGRSNGLLTWKFTLRRVPWGLMFMIGAGFAIAEGANKSGLSERLTSDMEGLEKYSSFGILAVSALVAGIMSQITTNVGVASIVMPVLCTVAKAADVHPLYVMFPTALACSFGYFLPVSTPPNALVADLINMPTLEMMKVGVVVLIMSYLVLLAVSAAFLPLMVEVNKFPLNAYMTLDVGV